MTRRFGTILTTLFVGVFVFTVAFTLATNSANAGDPVAGECCEVWVGEDLYMSGVWVDDSKFPPSNLRCSCAPMMPGGNPNNCTLLCPSIE